MMQANTGVTADDFEFVYKKYCGPDTPIPMPENLFDLLKFYKIYPTARQFPSVFEGQSALSFGWFLRRVKDWGEFLAGCIDELADSLATRNSAQNDAQLLWRGPRSFCRGTVGAIDTAPIVIDRPNGAIQSKFYNGKYKQHVLKFQLVCNNIGELMFFSGPHFGVIHDLKLYENFPPPLDRGERLLGDKAYCARRHSPRLVTPKKRTAAEALSPIEEKYNDYHGFHRATVEHCIGYVKRFRVLGGTYRGQISADGLNVDELCTTGNDAAFRDGAHCGDLQNALKIIIHVSNIHLKKAPRRRYIPLDPQEIQRHLDERIRQREVELKAAESAEAADRIRLNFFDFVNGTGNTVDDFKTSDKVEIFLYDQWNDATVKYISILRRTVTLRFPGDRMNSPGYLPFFIRHKAQ